MHPLVLLAAAGALRCPGALALTLGGHDADPGEGAAGMEACLAAAGLPSCPPGGADPQGAPPGCLDAALLAEDMGELGFGAEGCARAGPRGAGGGAPDVAGAARTARVGAHKPQHKPRAAVVRENPLSVKPDAGDVPPANVSHERPVMWVHVHKSMGTFVYSLALMSGENVVRPSFNGNWWPHDTPSVGCQRHGAPCKRRGVTCQRRSEWFGWSNATWGQIEHQIEDDDLCHEHFNYGILLRDPNELAISKASYEAYSPRETIASLGCLAERRADGETQNRTAACDRAAPKKNGWKLWWFWDNFLVRTLGGEAVWSLPAGHVTAQHARAVIERLSRFEAVVFADDFEEREYLEQTVGWKREFYETASTRKSKHVVELDGLQDMQARRTNRLDYMVIQHFRKIPMRERIQKFS